MKGQAFIIPETIIDVLKNLLFIAFLVGLFLLFSVYNIKVEEMREKRTMFDSVNVVLGDKCLLYEDETGNFYKNILDEEKLNDGNICVELKGLEIEITDLENSWKFGSSTGKSSFELPVTIHSNGKFKLGKMVMRY